MMKVFEYGACEGSCQHKGRTSNEIVHDDPGKASDYFHLQLIAQIICNNILHDLKKFSASKHFLSQWTGLVSAGYCP